MPWSSFFVLMVSMLPFVKLVSSYTNGSHGDFCAAYDWCIHSGGKEKKFHQMESYEEILEFMEGRKIEPMDPVEWKKRFRKETEVRFLEGF